MNGYRQSGSSPARVEGRPFGVAGPDAYGFGADEAHVRGASGLLPPDKAYGITTRGAVARCAPDAPVMMPAAKVAARPTGGSQHVQVNPNGIPGSPGYVRPASERKRRKRGGRRRNRRG